MKYYKNVDNDLFIDAIVSNHTGLIEITKFDFDFQLELNNTITQEQAIINSNNLIYSQLLDIDKKSIRAIRENDTARIQALNDEATLLRSQINVQV